jgi:glycerol-3-phosphate O-acyltransferase
MKKSQRIHCSDPDYLNVYVCRKFECLNDFEITLSLLESVEKWASREELLKFCAEEVRKLGIHKRRCEEEENRQKEIFTQKRIKEIKKIQEENFKTPMVEAPIVKERFVKSVFPPMYEAVTPGNPDEEMEDINKIEPGPEKELYWELRDAENFLKKIK